MSAKELVDHLCSLLGVRHVALGRCYDQTAKFYFAWVAIERRPAPWLADEGHRWRCIGVGRSEEELVKAVEDYAMRQQWKWGRIAA